VAEGVVVIGVAQEKMRAFKAQRSCDPSGRPCSLRTTRCLIRFATRSTLSTPKIRTIHEEAVLAA
jgi:hypothetical protein